MLILYSRAVLSRSADTTIRHVAHGAVSYTPFLRDFELFDYIEYLYGLSQLYTSLQKVTELTFGYKHDQVQSAARG